MRTKSLELVEEYIESVWNRGDLESLDRLTSPEFTYVLGGQPPRDRSAMRRFIEMTKAGFPDWCVTVQQAVSDGEIVAVRWEGTVTHAGPFHGIPPTGKRVVVSGMNMYEVRHGRILKEWEQMDSLGLLSQLGMDAVP